MKLKEDSEKIFRKFIKSEFVFINCIDWLKFSGSPLPNLILDIFQKRGKDPLFTLYPPGCFTQGRWTGLTGHGTAARGKQVDRATTNYSEPVSRVDRPNLADSKTGRSTRSTSLPDNYSYECQRYRHRLVDLRRQVSRSTMVRENHTVW